MSLIIYSNCAEDDDKYVIVNRTREWKRIFANYKLTISLFFESFASNQEHPEILEEVSLPDQAPY